MLQHLENDVYLADFKAIDLIKLEKIYINAIFSKSRENLLCSWK